MHTANFTAKIQFSRDVSRLEPQISAVITQIPWHWNMSGNDMEMVANLFCAPDVADDGCSLSYSLQLGSETANGLSEAIAVLKEFCDRQIKLGESFNLKLSGGDEMPVVVAATYGTDSHDFGKDRAPDTRLVETALRHVAKLFPGVTHVFYGENGRVLYCDDDLNRVPISGAVDEALVQAAAMSMTGRPAAFSIRQFG